MEVGVFEHGSTRSSRRYSRGTGVFIPRVINGINEYKPLQGRDSFAVSPASVCIMEKRKLLNLKLYELVCRVLKSESNLLLQICINRIVLRVYLMHYWCVQSSSACFN